MERNMFNVSFTDHNPMSINGMSNMFTCPLIQPDALDPNSQSQIMVSYPFLPTWNGEAVYGHNLMNHVGINDSEASVSTSMPFHNTDFQQHFMGGTTLSATSLANLLSTRTGLHGNLNELQVDQYRDSVSNNCYNNSNSSNTNSVNRGFGLQEGMEFLESEKDARMNSQLEARWDFNKFLGPPEFSGRSSLRTVGDLYSYNTPSNELSLTLSTQPNINVQNISDQCSEISCSGVTHDDSMRKIGSSSKPITSNCRDLSLGFGSRQPIQFSHLLSGSKYLRAVQQILTEIASQSVRNQDFQTWFDPNVSLSSRFTTELGSSVTGSGPFPSLAGETTSKDQMDFTLEIQNSESKKSQLLTLLQLVDSRYNQCLDEIHTVVSAFHAATELDPQIHASFALQTVCHLYKSVRKRIASQILKTGELLTNDYSSENSSFESSFIQKQWALQQLKKKDHQPWRPQRGLPEKSVSILRAWLFQNFLHPYPRDTEKHLLSIRSGLTRNQVSNWFINARVRLWKPMIEEMYTEMNNRNGYQTDNRTNDGDGSNYINIDNNQSLRVNYSDGNY